MQSLQEDQRSLMLVHIVLEHQLHHHAIFPAQGLLRYSNLWSYMPRQFPYLLYHHGSAPQSITHLFQPVQQALLQESSKIDSACALDQPFSPPWTTGDFVSESARTAAILHHAI